MKRKVLIFVMCTLILFASGCDFLSNRSPEQTTAVNSKTGLTAALTKTVAATATHYASGTDTIRSGSPILTAEPTGTAPALETPQEMVLEQLNNVVYSTVDGMELKMDITLPKGASTPLPVIVFLHGGGWFEGDKNDNYVFTQLVANYGYAAVSVQYRLSTQKIFPAQVEDVKTAIRYLKSKASQYNIDPQKIGIIGFSAGGHLATFLGTTGTSGEYDGDGREYAGFKSTVAAVADFYGPTNLSSYIDYIKDDPAYAENYNYIFNCAQSLIGGDPNQYKDRLDAASPVKFVDGSDAPFFIVHGDSDTIVPVDQSQQLYDKLRAAGVDATLYVVPGAGHGFWNLELVIKTIEFFDRYLKT